MEKRVGLALLCTGVGIGMPFLSWAQDVPITGLSSNIAGLQSTLDSVYDTAMGNCGELVGVGQALAGFGALFYVCYRVLGHIAKAEDIEVLPLLRPFVLSLVLSMYPGFIGVINGILQPTVDGTAALVKDANAAITLLLSQKQAALQQSADWQMFVGPDGNGSQEKWEQYSGEAESGAFSGISNALKFNLERISYNFHNAVKVVLSEIMELVYEAASLCINTLRIFEMVLMAILGPLVLGLTCFDGFKHLLTAWLARYVNVFLWLPVANIFGSLCGQIQIAMLKADLANAANGQTSFGATDAAYLIFLLIASIGYFCVPSVTNHIINVFPSGGGAMLSKVTGGAKDAAEAPVAAAATAAKVAGAAI